MTEHEWRQLLPLMRRIKPERLKAAYNRLVKGDTLEAAGEIAGISRQGVHDLVTDILEKQMRLHESHNAAQTGIPEGWVRVTVDIPASAVAEVQRFATTLAHKHRVNSRGTRRVKSSR
jgi:hypothetical protein